MTDSVILALGSNVAPERHLPLAVKALEDLGRIRRLSQAHDNPALGPAGRPTLSTPQ